MFVSGNVSHHETIGRPANTSTPFGQHALSQDNQYRQNYSTHTRFGEDSGTDSDILLYITIRRMAMYSYIESGKGDLTVQQSLTGHNNSFGNIQGHSNRLQHSQSEYFNYQETYYIDYKL